MNRNTALALLRDTFAQVVDSMVFRIMMVLLAILVLPAFMVSIQEDRFVILFFVDLPYEDIARYWGGAVSDGAQIDIIEGFQSLLLAEGKVNPLAWMARSTVLMLCVFATAFFMPRMLEKGAADTIFSKPVSRLVLMLSRYFAGLLFVSLCVTFAIGGVHVGLLLRSGHSDPGWLWLIPELIYSFAVFHAFSVAIGVFTRSSVASILLTSMFFFGNGCTHFFWRSSLSSEVSTTEGAVKEGDEDLSDKLLGGMNLLFETLHVVLPKTIDARLITESLRRRTEQSAVELADSDSGLTVEAPPEGFQREPRSSLARDGVLWIAPHPEGAAEATLRLSRASRNETESRVAQARNLENELKQDVPGDGITRTEIDGQRAFIGGRRADIISWREQRGSEERLRETSFFQSGEWIFTLELDAETGWASDSGREDVVRTFTEGMHFPEIEINPPDEFEQRFGWDAPLLYNGWFSIGSTLAFILAMLGLGWWKLSRIDF